MEASPDNCSVKVAVHIRPLVSDERLQSCNDCLTVVPGMPQVQIGTHSFTFDHVYGGRGSPSTSMFEECISPLVDGLFQGYCGTVLAYGQVRVRHTPWGLESDFVNGHFRMVTVPGKHPIQIRETSNGVVTLAGSTEVSVSTLNDMVACLEQGSLSWAKGSTNMNNQSSRSHAIFTITLEQMHKFQPAYNGEASSRGMGEEYLFAKLHLVDLAGSERAKRTGSDGHHFKEGIHINKGLLALGNVISALADEKKQKGQHVPYRDSKLSRLLQGKASSSLRHCADDKSGASLMSLPVAKQRKYTAGIANKSIRVPAADSDQTEKMLPIATRQCGKLWRWKRSHDQWLLQFRWKWQKPWKLSEWIKYTDETSMRSRPWSLTLSQNV